MILIQKTFNDIAIERYQLPEVREIITKFALMQDSSWQALNEDFRKTMWFLGHVREVLSHYECQRIVVFGTDIKDEAYLFRALSSKTPRQNRMTSNEFRSHFR